MSEKTKEPNSKLKIFFYYGVHMLLTLLFAAGIAWFSNEVVLEHAWNGNYFVFSGAILGVIMLYSLLERKKLYASVRTVGILMACFLVSGLLLLLSDYYVNLPIWLIGGIAAAALVNRNIGMLYLYYFVFHAIYLQGNWLNGLVFHFVVATLIAFFIPKMKTFLAMFYMMAVAACLIVTGSILHNQMYIDEGMMLDTFYILCTYLACIFITMLLVKWNGGQVVAVEQAEDNLVPGNYEYLELMAQDAANKDAEAEKARMEAEKAEAEKLEEEKAEAEKAEPENVGAEVETVETMEPEEPETETADAEETKPEETKVEVSEEALEETQEEATAEEEENTEENSTVDETAAEEIVENTEETVTTEETEEDTAEETVTTEKAEEDTTEETVAVEEVVEEAVVTEPEVVPVPEEPVAEEAVAEEAVAEETVIEIDYSPYCDEKAPLLQELRVKDKSAHARAILVGKLAAETAQCIGLDAQLTKAGGLYKIIGKIRENSNEYTTAEVAKEHNFPEPLIYLLDQLNHNIIEQKEAAVILMTDGVISYYSIVRAAKKTDIPVEKIVDTIVSKKIFQGEFNESGLNMQECFVLREKLIALLKAQDMKHAAKAAERKNLV